MPGINYIFLKNNYLLFFLVIILITGNTCTPNTLWDIPVETIKQNLYHSDYAFIKGIDFNEKKASDIRVLGPGAFHYFSFIFSRTGYPEIAEKIRLLSWQKEKKYWKAESGIIILKQFLEQHEYKLLEFHALEYLKKTKEPENLVAVKKLYIEALSRQNKDQAVLDAIKRFFPDEKVNEEEDPELLFFKAIAGCNRDKKGWTDSFIHLFLAFQSSSLHERAYQYIMRESTRFKAFDKGMQQYLVAKSLLSAGNHDLAIPLVEFFLNAIKPEILEGATIISELGLVYLSSGKYEQGLKFLTTLSEKLSGRVKLDALEMAGRIARKNNDYTKAVKYLNSVVRDTEDPIQKDRAAWFYLACILEISPLRFIDEVILYAKQWNDPAYFDDIIQKSISILVAGKKWQPIQYMYESLLPLASETIIIQLEFLIARFLMEGYIKEQDPEQKITQYLQKVSKVNDDNYYAFFAALLLHQEPLFLEYKASEESPETGLNRKKLTSLEAFITGFFDFGLIEDGYSILMKYRESISNQVILYLVKRLQEHGYYKESIWLMNTYRIRKDNQLTKKELMYAYPAAYRNIIEMNAQKRDFFPPVFYSLVREESAFDAGNTSVAGAVGLSQLMPVTANDIAGWLRLDEYDLTDPETNILMGSYYYARLLGVLKNIPAVLIAYNAGPGNLRRWEKEYKGLPPDLFIEAIPFRETRGYVKKIISTACIYSYLYYKIPSSGVFAILFPGMFSR
ncbi:MAG: lytic transglycosylase domain-containing protein [Spirochaetales bacterium]|nr:lytic transglycosylase domain-containing protein [Spirochaetales bacterium]